MTRSTRLTLSLLSTSMLVLCTLVRPPVLAADEPGPAAIRAPASDSPQMQQVEYWRARGDAARAEVAQAHDEFAAAAAAVARMRTRNHPRGEARIQLREERAQAQAKLAAAVERLEIELPAEARMAGAQVSWLRARE